MKKLFFIALLGIMTVNGATAQDVIASGVTGAQGNNLTWTLTNIGVLTISGSGDMQDFRGIPPVGTSDAPWQRRGFRTVMIEDGVTSIGDWAFSASGIVSVTIGNDITRIGEWAFFSCRNLSYVTIGSGVTSIEAGAFATSSELTYVVCYALVPPALDWAFGVLNQPILFVPAQSISLYMQAPEWQDFEIRAIEDGIPPKPPLPTITTNVNDTQASQVFVYPSLVTDSFQIGGIEADTFITVSDTNGRIVLQRVVAPNEMISVSHLPQGIYFVNVNEKTMKIIKSGM